MRVPFSHASGVSPTRERRGRRRRRRSSSAIVVLAFSSSTGGKSGKSGNVVGATTSSSTDTTTNSTNNTFKEEEEEDRAQANNKKDIQQKAHQNDEEEGNKEEEGKEGQACPYSSVKSFFGMEKKEVPDLRPEDGSEPPVIDDISFLKSLVKAAQHPVGMPIAMLDWAEQKGECVGIQNAIGPDCVSILDPEIVEYVCHTNAKNYKLRMLPDAFRFVIKNKGITGSDGQYNREHRLMCQKPFINSFSLTQFSTRSKNESITCAKRGERRVPCEKREK